MPTSSLTAEKVVDLIRYRQARERAPRPHGQGQRPALTPVTPFRPLSAREVAHRERMLAHLVAATSPPSC